MKNFLAEISTDNNVHDINYIKDISDSELTSIEHYIGILDEVQHLMDLFVVLRFNFDDIIQFQTTEVQPIIERINPINHLKEKEYAFLKVEINRFVNNYLSAFRMFIDHSDVKIGRRFKKDSKEYKMFISMANKAYDNNFSYRFAYKLRNFCQHCGLPITGFEIEGIEKGSKFMFSFVRDYLLTEYDSWGPRVKEDLTNGNQNININVVLNNHFRIVSKISEEIHSLYELIFNEAISFLHEYTSSYRTDKELVMIKQNCDVKNLDNLIIGKFPFELIDKFNNGSS